MVHGGGQGLVAFGLGVVARAFTCGPQSLAQRDGLAARQVVVGHGQVEHASVGERLHLLHGGPRRTCSWPTSEARPRSRNAPAVISEALALPPSTSTTTGSLGATASPWASSVRLARLRPRTETILPLSMNWLEHQHGLTQKPAAVAAQVEHVALGALLLQALYAAVRTSAWAPVEKLAQLDHADLLALALDQLALHQGNVDLGPLDAHGARLLPRPALTSSSLTLVPAGPLMRPVATRAVHAGERAAVDGGDQVALGDARLARGRLGKAVEDAQAAAVLVDGHPHALELAFDGLGESRPRWAGGSREGVVQRLDRALQGALAELRRVHPCRSRPGSVGDLRLERAIVLDEGFARESGSLSGCPPR